MVQMKVFCELCGAYEIARVNPLPEIKFADVGWFICPKCGHDDYIDLD